MSTNDVPGAVAYNHDELALGCWAEHPDSSLIFVESAEGSRIIYSMFDLQAKLEYRHAMPEVNFKKEFSWKANAPTGKGVNEKWTWHDKTPFPWDRVIAADMPDGVRHPDAGTLMTAAERVASHLRITATGLRAENHAHKAESHIGKLFTTVKGRLGRALNELRSDG